MSDASEQDQELKTYVLSIVQRLDEMYAGRFDLLEKKLEVQEQQLALLTQSYAELAVLIQTIMQVKFDEIDAGAFHEAMKENGKLMLEVLGGAAEQNQADNEKFYPPVPGVDNSTDAGDSLPDS